VLASLLEENGYDKEAKAIQTFIVDSNLTKDLQ